MYICVHGNHSFQRVFPCTNLGRPKAREFSPRHEIHRCQGYYHCLYMCEWFTTVYLVEEKKTSYTWSRRGMRAQIYSPELSAGFCLLVCGCRAGLSTSIFLILARPTNILQVSINRFSNNFYPRRRREYDYTTEYFYNRNVSAKYKLHPSPFSENSISFVVHCLSHRNIAMRSGWSLSLRLDDDPHFPV